MPSPFPGMDPYLEDPAFWPDFHESFVIYCRDVLNDALPDNYEARIDERLNLVALPEEYAKAVKPDVAIIQDRPSRQADREGAVATLEPVTLPLVILDEVRESRVQILHRPDLTLVTVIELLSPTNKSAAGYGDYLQKRWELLATPTHLVEIDLLIGGHRLPVGGELPPGDYYVYVAPGDRRRTCDVYAWRLRNPLPTIPIPLKAPHPDIPLDLASLFTYTYDKGRYARSLKYGAPPRAPLDPDTHRWAVEQAKSTARSTP